MKKKRLLFVFGLVVIIPPTAFAGGPDIDGLFGSWCMTGMSAEIDGERTPDKASYTFTKDNVLKYDAGFFKQEEAFTIAEDKIKTKSMGNYKIISITGNEMVLNYGGFMFFTKGMCK